MFKRACGVGLPLVAAVCFAVAASAAAVPTGGLNWDANATAFAGQNGLLVAYKCPPKSTLGTIYGTGVYTDDSKGLYSRSSRRADHGRERGHGHDQDPSWPPFLPREHAPRRYEQRVRFLVGELLVCRHPEGAHRADSGRRKNVECDGCCRCNRESLPV